MPGDVVFAAGALLMAWDFVLKLRPFYPRLLRRRHTAVVEEAASPIGLAARDAH